MNRNTVKYYLFPVHFYDPYTSITQEREKEQVKETDREGESFSAFLLYSYKNKNEYSNILDLICTLYNIYTY